MEEFNRGRQIIDFVLKSNSLRYILMKHYYKYPTVFPDNAVGWVSNIIKAVLPDIEVYVDDLAVLAYEQSRQIENTIIDAIGPETFTYRDLVRTIAEAIGKRRPGLWHEQTDRMVRPRRLRHKRRNRRPDGKFTLRQFPARRTHPPLRLGPRQRPGPGTKIHKRIG